MLALQNLTTGEHQQISGPVTITSEDLLLMDGESPRELSHLDTVWTREFPGKSHLISSLRSDLVRADWLRRRARIVFQQIQLDLYSTGLPLHLWDRFTRQHLHFFEKHAARTQNEFRKALRLLMTCKPAPAKAEEPPPPPKPELDYRGIVQQVLRVYVADGKTITESSLTPQQFLDPDLFVLTGIVWRSFFFEGAVVPDEYAYALHHQGVDYPPAESIIISYQPEDFKEICEREIQTSAEFCLDGKRSGYRHLPYVPLVET